MILHKATMAWMATPLLWGEFSSRLIWGLVLLGVGMLLLVLELFVPSAGALLAAACLCTVAAIVALFIEDPMWGLAGLGVVAVVGPLVFYFWTNVWPNTRFGRAVIGAPTEEEAARQRQAEEEQRRAMLSLLGAEGVVKTECRPVGVVEINGRRYDALSENFFIQPGTKVRVTSVEGTQIKVRAVS